MKLAYNPITEAALSSAPNSNDIIFDLKGLNIFAKGIKFKGTDTTYSVFKKHTSSSGGGYNGLVPVPSYTTSNNRYLREDGTWLVPSNQYTYSQLNNTDLDTLKTEGKWYYISGGSNNTNGPDGFNNGAELYVGRNASGYRYQKVITLDGDIWVRIFNSSSWGSWTRWYTDANTDSKVLLSATTTSNYRPLILGYLNNTDVSSLANSTTNQVYTTTKIYALPSTGYLWANKLYSGGKEVLTSHLSLSNYVTINTAQTITGAKTFTGNIYVPSGYIYGVNESGGGILFFDGTRTVIGSIGESTTSATHIRSKTGHITVGTSNDVLYNILDSGNSVYGSSTTSLPIYTPLKINGTTKNISLHGHKHTISDITNFSHTHTSNLITALTGYSKATSVASLNTSDSLNTALGKLEYKLGIAYDLVATANDNDGTIENLKEVLDVLLGIKDTDTILALLDKYLPLTGGTITGNLTVKGQLNANSDIKITNNGSIHWNNATWQLRILITDDSSSGTPVFNFQQSSNSGSSWSALALIYDNGTVHSNGYVKSGSSDSYILLGGGGHKAVGDFATSSSLGNYLPLTGGTMKGNITISTDSYILWNRNTDYAKIHFKNDSDSDSDSYLGFETGDNGNEYFKFSAKNGSTTTELLSIKYDALRFRGTVVSLNGHTHDDRYYTESEINSKLNNYVTLTTNQTISGIKTFSTLLKFTVAKGTAPFTVTSDTVVTNLNADKLDGVHLNGIFTGFSANGNATRLVIGGVTKDLTIPYSVKSELLSYYTLPYTNYDKIGWYCKIASVSLTSLYSSKTAILCITDEYTTTSTEARYGFIYVKIQQQNSMGSSPNIVIRVSGSITPSLVTGILTLSSSSSKLDIYFKEDLSYLRGYITFIHGAEDIRTNSLELVLNLPSGTVISSLYGDISNLSVSLLNSRKINGTSFNGTSDITTSYWGTSRNVYILDSAAAHTGAAVSVNGSSNIYLKLPATITGTLSGNASTATKLQTARTLWGLSFDGSANVSGTMSNIPTIINLDYLHRFEIGRVNFDHWDFYEYGGTFNFYKCLDATGLSKTLLFNISPTYTYVLGNLGVGTTSPSLRLHVSGNVLSSGFMKSGSSDSYLLLGGGGHKAISDFMLKTDELSTNVTTITKSLNVTTSWMDTGINGTDLSTGTYIILLNADFNGTGSLWYCYFSGIMSWFSSNTNDSEADEILLHRAGHAYHNTLYLRTVQTTNGSGGMKLLIAASSSIGSTQNYTFKFKRII